MVVVAGGLAKVAAQNLSDKILERQFERAHATWEKEGSQIGYNWAPPDVGMLARFFQFKGRTAGQWLFHTPEWAMPYRDVRRLLVWFRVCESVFALGMIGLLLIIGFDTARSR